MLRLLGTSTPLLLAAVSAAAAQSLNPVPPPIPDQAQFTVSGADPSIVAMAIVAAAVACAAWYLTRPSHSRRR